jgi:hypothetical protein
LFNTAVVLITSVQEMAEMIKREYVQMKMINYIDFDKDKENVKTNEENASSVCVPEKKTPSITTLSPTVNI